MYAENDLSKMLYRIRSFFRIPFTSEVVSKATDMMVGSVSQQFHLGSEDYLINVHAVEGTISKCRFCFSRTWSVDWNRRRITVQGDLLGRNFQFLNEQGQPIGSMTYQWHWFRKNEWRLVATDGSLPDAFYMSALSAIEDGT